MLVESPETAYRAVFWLLVSIGALQLSGVLLWVHEKTHQLTLARLGYSSRIEIWTEQYGPVTLCSGGVCRLDPGRQARQMRRSDVILTALTPLWIAAPLLAVLVLVAGPHVPPGDLVVLGAVIVGVAGPSSNDYVTAVVVALGGVPDPDAAVGESIDAGGSP